MKKRIMIDSSIWISYLRYAQGTTYDQLDNLIAEDQAVICGIIELEILQGLRQKERNIVSELFQTIHYVNVERTDYIAAGNRLRELRENGITIPPSDCLIAILCKKHKLPIFTLDKDFNYITDIEMINTVH